MKRYLQQRKETDTRDEICLLALQRGIQTLLILGNAASAFSQMAGLIRRVILNNGHSMPLVGLGTYQLLGDDVREVLDRALFMGYRHIDTAKSYGNESEIGEVLQTRLKYGGLKRNQLFLTTKVPDVFHAPNHVKQSVEESKELLKQASIDMVLIHHPWGVRYRGDGDLKPKNEKGTLDFQQSDLTQTWKALEELVKAGDVKSIGLSNFTIKQMENILNSCEIVPANLQLECHAYLQQTVIHDFCRIRGITLTAYSPLGAPGRPTLHRSEDQPILLEDSLLDQLSNKHRKTKAQILLRWLIQRGICVVPKSKSEKRLHENVDIFDFEVDHNDLKTIEGMDRRTRFFTFQYMTGHPDFDVSLDF